MTAFLRIFRRFPTTFRRFPKISQNCSKGQTNVPEHFPRIPENFRRCPKISEHCRSCPKTSEKDPKMFRWHTNEFNYNLRDKRDITEIIDIFTCEDIVSFLSICYHSLYHWLLDNKFTYYILISELHLSTVTVCDKVSNFYCIQIAHFHDVSRVLDQG